MDSELATLLTDLIEKIGLLRRDLKHRGDLEKYEARVSRGDHKFSALAERISRTDPALAQGLEDRLAASRPQPRLPEREASEEGRASTLSWSLPFVRIRFRGRAPERI